MGRKTLIISSSLLVAVLVASLAAADITRVSISDTEAQAIGPSYESQVSQNGQSVAFLSDAWNLAPGDTNNRRDVYVRNLIAGTTTRWSTPNGGGQGGGYSEADWISADGRYVCFMSASRNLVPVDTNGWEDVFVKDTLTNTTTLVSVDSNEVQANRLSNFPIISADARYVLFTSMASNLVPGDTNGQTDIFRRDLQLGTTERVNLSSAGAQANGSMATYDVSDDGRYIVWDSTATNLVAGDVNGFEDVFMRDLVTGVTTLVSVDPAGVQGTDLSFWPSIAGGGRFVSFGTFATNFVALDANGPTQDIFVKDTQTGALTMVDVSDLGVQGNAGATAPVPLSFDGRYAGFSTFSGNLVPGDANFWWDAYRYDLQTKTVLRLSMGLAGAEPNHNSNVLSISGDGQAVTIDSNATNLVPLDNNGQIDVFLWTPGPPPGGATALTWAGTAGYVTDGVEPATGTAATNITWKVLYTDPAGRLPGKKNLVIQQKVGAAWTAYALIPMTLESGTPATGAVYSYASTLPVGVYRYRFQFTVGGVVVTGPPQTFRPGPRIN